MKVFKVLIVSLLVVSQVAQASSSALEEFRRVDPEGAAKFEELLAQEKNSPKMSNEELGRLRLTQDYDQQVRELFNMSQYLRTRGDWFLDAEVARKWIVPLMTAMTLYYNYNKDVPTNQGLSNRQKLMSASLSAGIIGVLAFAAATVKKNKDLAAFDADSNEEVAAKYMAKLCKLNVIGNKIGRPAIVNVDGKLPVCR